MGKKRPVSCLEAIKTIKRRKRDDEEQDDVQMDEFVYDYTVGVISLSQTTDGWMDDDDEKSTKRDKKASLHALYT